MSEEEFKKFKEELKPIFRGYKKVNASMKKRLKEMGFEFVREKNHYILKKEIAGQVLFFEIDKTPGDFRSGIKTVKDITKVIRFSGVVNAV